MYPIGKFVCILRGDCKTAISSSLKIALVCIPQFIYMQTIK